MLISKFLIPVLWALMGEPRLRSECEELVELAVLVDSFGTVDPLEDCIGGELCQGAQRFGGVDLGMNVGREVRGTKGGIIAGGKPKRGLSGGTKVFAFTPSGLNRGGCDGVEWNCGTLLWCLMAR